MSAPATSNRHSRLSIILFSAFLPYPADREAVRRSRSPNRIMSSSFASPSFIPPSYVLFPTHATG